MVSRLVHEHTGVVPTTLDQPETVVARGALRAVQVIPDRTGMLPGTGPQGRPGRQVSAQDRRTDVVARPDYPVRQGRPPLSGPMPRHPVQGRPMATPPSPPQGNPTPVPLRPTRTPSSRRRRALLWVVAIAAAVAVAAITTVVLVSRDGDQAAAEGRTFAQYSYKFVAPADWTQTGDNVADRQVVVKPSEAQTSADDDLVVVQEFVLSYDGGANRTRLARELRDQADDKPDLYSDFAEHHTFAGRDVIHYKENKPAATVNWYVLARGTAQVSVGCQEAEMPHRVRAACEQIVRTLEFTN